MNSPLFDWLLAASLRASLLTAVVLLAQTLLRKRLSASWRHALWLPVLLVLLTPSFPESRWSIGSLLQPTRAPLAAPTPAAVPTFPTIDSRSLALEPLLSKSQSPAPIPWGKIAGVTWMLGAAGLGGIGLARFLQTLRQFRRSRLPLSSALRDSIAAVAAEIGLSKVPRIWIGSAIQSPAVTGLFRPILLLPADFEESLSPEERRLVLKHELTHIQRGDLPLNTLLCLLLVLHWFNPVLWIAFFKSRQDRETACDARVLERETTPQRVAYGHALLKVETAFRNPGLGLGFVGIFGRGSALRSRVESLFNQPNTHPMMKTTLSLSLAFLTFLGVTQAAPPDSTPPTNAPQPAQPAAPQTPQPGSIEDKLSRIVLPRVQFQDATLEEAIEFLRQRSKKLDTSTEDPTRKGVNIVLGVSEEASPAKVSMQMNDVPLGVVLKYVAELSNLRLTVTPHAVVFRSQNGLKEGQIGEALTITSKAVTFIKAKGQTVFEGDVEIQTPHGVLSGRDITLSSQPKAGNVELPKVDLRGATLKEAVDFIQIKTRALDPDKSGFNVLIKPGGDPETKINLLVENIPAWEALRYSADLAKYRLSFDGNGAVLTPQAN